MPDQHALLSASGAHRWLVCPPSATLEAGLPESTSQAAEQGTAAHELAEWKLRRVLHDAPTTKPVSSWHDAEMETLTDDYVAFVQERLRDVRRGVLIRKCSSSSAWTSPTSCRVASAPGTA